VSAIRSRRNQGRKWPLGRQILPSKGQTVIRLAGSQPRAIVARLTKGNGPDAARQISSGSYRSAPGNNRMEEIMNRKKSTIDSCIDHLRGMLEDSNNELSSEQQRKLKKGITELKRLKRAKKLTHLQVSAVVSEVASVAFEILMSGPSE
jgi:hypothetical protein